MASTSPAITKALRDELEALKVKVNTRADYEVRGDYRDVDDRQKEMLVRVTAEVVDKAGRKLLDLSPGEIFDPPTMAAILGPTGPPKATATSGSIEPLPGGGMLDAVKNPQPAVMISRVSAGKESPYAVEILAVYGEEVAPRQVEDRDGFPFVKLHQDETYEVNLINKSDYDAAVTLTIDGLNVFQFSENREYVHWIVPAKSSLVVKGWHRSNQVSDRFAVRGLADSAAAKELRTSSEIGTITAVFAAAWPVEGPVPPGENAGKGEAETAQGKSGTGFGMPVKADYREVRRRVGRFRSSVSVRYDKALEPKDLPKDQLPGSIVKT